jgi:hypothetical protein
MTAGPNEIIDAALKLSDSDRLLIATRLLDTLPEEFQFLEEDPGMLAELERRASDTSATIPAAEIWNEE